MVVIALGWWYGPPLIHKAKLAFYERKVAGYTAPASRVVYEEDPSLWPALLAQLGYRQFIAGGAGWNNYVGYTAGPVQSLAQAGPITPLGATALFAHTRRTPAGHECVVVVWMAYNGIRANAQGATPDNQVQITLRASTVKDARMLSGQFLPLWIAPQSIAENRTTPLYARIYAGQVDPADSSHFTISYQIGQYTDQLDGYLRDDGNVVIHPRQHQHMLNPK